jgi:uracil-DNA glycosylase family 4
MKNETLEDLTDEILICEDCDLREFATCPVPGHGNVGAKYFIIGEAPGREEDEAGIPFIGAAGRKLDALLDLAGININDCYLTNTVKCRPPKNRDPRKKELKVCLPFLWRELKLVKPEYIITLGSVPLKALLPEATVSQYHGTMFTFELEDE